MKILKVLVLTVIAALGALPAAADDLYVLLYPTTYEINVKAGNKFDLVLNLDNNVRPSSFQYYLELPEGMSVVKSGLKYSYSYSSRLNQDMYVTAATLVKGTNTVLFTAYNQPEYNYVEYDEYRIQPGEGTFVTIPISVSDEMKGTYEMVLNKIKFVTLDESAYVSPEAVITVNVSESTGIETVTAESGEAEYFNMQGQRVKPTAPGIYIRRIGSKVTKMVL